MSELSMMVTITERSKLTTFLSFYRERQVPVQFISLALGTASNETLNYLGLERSDKCVFASFVTDEKWEELRRGLRRELQIDVPGMGIAFTVPLSSIGGRRELQFLTEHQNYQKGEESTMKDTKYELLVVIANHGYSDLIMDAARGAGAAGGTVIHAKGTGMEGAEKFLGISLAAEKGNDLHRRPPRQAQRDHVRHHARRGHGEQGEVHLLHPARLRHGGPAAHRRGLSLRTRSKKRLESRLAFQPLYSFSSFMRSRWSLPIERRCPCRLQNITETLAEQSRSEY